MMGTSTAFRDEKDSRQERAFSNQDLSLVESDSPGAPHDVFKLFGSDAMRLKV